jgi:hypothetical protein
MQRLEFERLKSVFLAEDRLHAANQITYQPGLEREACANKVVTAVRTMLPARIDCETVRDVI